MDDHARKSKKRKSEEDQEEKKKKSSRGREEKAGREREAASLPLSRGQQIAALSSPTDDAAALQKHQEKKARNLLHFQKQDAVTGEDPAEKPLYEKKKKKKHSALKLEELENQQLEDENLHKRNSREPKKDKEEDDQDIHEGKLHNSSSSEQEQQEEDQRSQEENPHTENKKRRKKKKEKKRKEEPNMDVDLSLCREIEEQQEQQEEDQHSQEEIPHIEHNKGEKKRNKKKKEKKRKEEPNISEIEKQQEQQEEDQHSQEENPQTENNKEEKKSKKKKEKKRKEEGDQHYDEGNLLRSSVEMGGHDPASNEAHDLLSNKFECSKEPLADQIEHVTNTSVATDSSRKEKEKEKQKRKSVTFQDQIKVADQEHVRDIPNAACENSTETVEEVWGVRFTPEEDEILKDAVWTYIKSKGWDEKEGLNKVFNSLKHKDARNCWADIKLSLPHRPRQAIRYRAHLLLEKGAHGGKWSEEEEQLLKRLQGEHGRKWKEISSLIDRHRTSLKEKWRSLKRTKGTGVWTQGELQRLSDMVHRCLRAKASIPVEKKKPNRHILKDEINWEKIADTIGTHNHGSCCGKWYYNLQSSLVTDGLWANEDDLLLLQSLLESGACVEEEVEWDSLLDHRPGQVCSTRWKQMVKHLGENRTRQFLDKLDILARRYAPELLEESSVNVEDSGINENPSGSAKISD